MVVYLVEDCHNSPGEIYAVFASKREAYAFCYAFEGEAEVVERTLFYGQPPIEGYNK